MDDSELVGLWVGLVESDGSIDKGKDRIAFASQSPHLIALFEALSALLGIDAHRRAGAEGCLQSVAYNSKRTTLESRKQYHGRRHHKGKVYCATTSTGLLVVRGAPDEFAFICGNTSPFEMCEVKLHLKMPMFVARQWIRHRTASLNEISGRYSVIKDEFYVPAPDKVRPQSKTNKQGREGELPATEVNAFLSEHTKSCQDAFSVYEDAIEAGVARETARMNLPLATYTEFYWKIDLHNLLHFLSLRVDKHAQWEIRAYAEKIEELVQLWCPMTYAAWRDWVKEAHRFSGPEMRFLRGLFKAPSLRGVLDAMQANPAAGISAGELREFILALKE